MGTVVIDAGIVIGVLDATDAHHQTAFAAIDAHVTDVLSLPASAYAEVLVGRVHAMRVARRAIDEFGIVIDPIEEATAEAAATLRVRFRFLRLPDALVLGHAEAIGADVVLTTDHRWAQVSPRVRVV